MPTAYFLIGVPCAGKSTWIAKQPFDWNHTVIASTDNFIDAAAKNQGKTYNDVFKSTFNDANENLDRTVRTAISKGYDVVWDQTNTSAGARRKKLAMFPAAYRKVAVVFPTPRDEELKRRHALRPGKEIPADVMASMIKNFQMPRESEGFDEIKVID